MKSRRGEAFGLAGSSIASSGERLANDDSIVQSPNASPLRCCDPYAAFADLYDLLLRDRQQTAAGAGAWLDALLRPLGVSSVLDCTCGTGLQSVALAQRGYAVSGSDLSRRMIGRAKKNARQAGVSVQWRQADVRLLTAEAIGQFDAVISCGSAMLHLTSRDDLRRAIGGVAAVTKSKGFFFLAVVDGEAVPDPALQVPPRIVAPDGSAISLFALSTRRGEIIRLKVFLTRDGPGGPKTSYRSIKLRMTSRAELSALLREAGFNEIEDVSGGSTLALLARRK